MQKLETVEAVYIYTHTGDIRKINKKEEEKIIKLFSNMLFLHTQKVCK